MLRLERLPKDRVAIRISEKSTSLDRRFWRSFLYSAFFHVLVFGTIRVEYLHIHESSLPLIPAEVAIDPEPAGDVAIVEPLEHNIPTLERGIEKLRPLFFKSPYAKEEQLFDTSTLISQVRTTQMQNLSTSPSRYATTVAKPYYENVWKERIYPLRLQLSSRLRNLQLILDGSALFRKKTPMDVVAKLRLTLNPLSVDYKVRVSGETGKVIQWNRKHELLDKKLQECADRLIQELQFGKKRAKNSRGTIRISFECTGDELESYLQVPSHD